jgi:serine phosphatase RsbU (regulator of sigma subunit)
MKEENAENLHSAQQSKMTTIIISLVIGLMLAIALAFTVFRSYTSKKRSNSELKYQKDKLLYSINYARRIQTAVIPSQKDIDAVFSDNFIFYRPKNIVSGDFYSAVRCGRYSVMITADCTGHGIPDAFLSMLGISALKEYMTTEDDAQNPGIVLDKMRSFIKSTLNAENDDSPSDGMEMTVCCLDLEKMEMKYAIANQTAYIVRQGKPITLRGDRMTIGKSIIESNNFKTQSMPIQHGDMLYMFSDGIQDQMSFVDGERVRFSSQRLRSLLIKASPLPVREQLDTIQQAVTEWQGDDLQIDDITLVGIRIN